MGNKIITPLVLIVGLCLVIKSLAQEPFDCDGRLFRVKEENGGTTFQEVLIDYETEEIEFEKLAFFGGYRVNGIAYRFVDDYIYGILLGSPYGLCRIHGDLTITRLADLPLPENMLFVSGDITPDGRYLVMLGYNPAERGNKLALIDLESENYETRLMPLSSTNEDLSIQCADIAFHPSTKILYGYDHSSNRIITIDIDQQLADNSTYPESSLLKGNVPTIFFDAFGNLFGMGSSHEFNSGRTFFSFNVETGAIRPIKGFGPEGNQDGCSCPYKVNLYNSISRREVFPCMDVNFQLKIVNKSAFEQTEIDLRDTFPPHMTIKSIGENPFGGQIISGIGTNILAIDNMIIPVGTDSLIVELELSEEILEGSYYNQAFLHGITLAENTVNESVFSDDPKTIKHNDPTYFYVENLKVDFGDEYKLICDGGKAALSPKLGKSVDYYWSTGEYSPEIEVDAPGVYEVTVTSGCEEASGSIEVRLTDIQVDLGESITIEEGTLIALKPDVDTESPVNQYLWTESESAYQTLPCFNCESPNVRPRRNKQYHVEVENEIGCRATDEIEILVTPFQPYIPNAFSPNGDQINDWFYIQGRLDYFIKSFQIFDRWGNLLFEETEILANQPELGWDGRFKGKALDSGVYVWSASVLAQDNSTIQLSGDVFLSK